MNKWLRELKALISSKDVINYYKKIIEEENLKTYEEICHEIGTPNEIFTQEKSNLDVEENKLGNARRTTLTILKKIIISILISLISIFWFCTIILILALVTVLISIPFQSMTLYGKLLHTGFLIFIIPTMYVLFTLFHNGIKKLSSMYKNKEFGIAKFKLKIRIPIMIVGGLICGVLGIFMYDNSQNEDGNLKTYSSTFTKGLDVNISDANINIYAGNEDKITYQAINRQNLKNDQINLEQGVNLLNFGILFNNQKHVKINISLKNSQKLNITGSNNNVNVNNVVLSNVNINGGDVDFKAQNIKFQKLVVNSIDGKINLTKSQVDNFESKRDNNKIKIKSSNIKYLNAEEYDTLLEIIESKISKINIDKENSVLKIKDSQITY